MNVYWNNIPRLPQARINSKYSSFRFHWTAWVIHCVALFHSFTLPFIHRSASPSSSQTIHPLIHPLTHAKFEMWKSKYNISFGFYNNNLSGRFFFRIYTYWYCNQINKEKREVVPHNRGSARYNYKESEIRIETETVEKVKTFGFTCSKSNTRKEVKVKGKACIRTKWPIRPSLILVSLKRSD